MKIEKEISSWARALYFSLEEHPENSDEIFANFKKFLNKKSVFIPAIMKKLQRIYLKEKTAELSLAHNFSEKEKEEIKVKIKGIVKGIDKVDDVLDESLLAGFRLKTKDVLIKASMKDILLKLKNKIYGYN
jgi:F0F1-type ATP synthase delta subunit